MCCSVTEIQRATASAASRGRLQSAAAQIAPSGAAWIHEIKHDGYRLMIRKDGQGVRIFTRRGYDCPTAIR